MRYPRPCLQSSIAPPRADSRREWIAAWNSGDLERIFALYADDFEMRSPLIAERGFSPDGSLRGKHAIRLYWGGGLAAADPRCASS